MSGDGDSECVIPPMPKRSRRTPGGQQKPDTELIFVTYDNAAWIGASLRSLCRHDDAVVLIVFDEDRLEFASMTWDDTMMFRVAMRRTAFVAFRGVGERREFVAPVASLQQWAAMCEAPVVGGRSQSFTLMYEQSGLRDEVLHMMLYPRDGVAAGSTVTRSSISPLCDDDGSAANVRLVAGRTDCYQYEIVLCARMLTNALAAVIDASECSVVTLVLAHNALELSALSRDARSLTTVACVVSLENDGALRDGQSTRDATDTSDVSASAAPGQPEMMLSRITSLQRNRMPLRLFRNHCIPAGQLRDLAHTVAAHLVHGSGGETITLRLGVDANEAPLPLFAEYQVRSDVPLSSYTVRCWIAPCVSD